MSEVDKERRKAVKALAALGGFFLAGLGAFSPLMHAEEVPSLEELFQRHYKQLSEKEKRRIFRYLEKRIKEEYQVKPHIIDPQPLKGVRYAMVINIARCVGCRRCVYACMKENNLSRSPQIQYIKVLEMSKGSINLLTSKHYYPENEIASKDFFYMPVQCHQCENPPCVKVCPVKATWKEPDGIVVVDYNWCIGCRYCEAACPYFARRFNWTKPYIPKEEINLEMGYLSNRIRYMGVMEKCTFCLHRSRKGRYTACVEACPTGARKFGNLNDPNSEVRKIIEKERVYVLKEELNTVPRLFYSMQK